MKTQFQAAMMVMIAAVTSTLIGCQIPGGTMGLDPAQMRFAAAGQAMLVAHDQAQMLPHYESEPRQTAANTSVVLASNVE